MDCVIICRRIK